MNPLLQLANGVRFFTGFVPSFGAPGHRARALLFEPLRADFGGQRWLVTGASSGLGRVIAREAARAGADVVAVARSREPLETLARETADAPGLVRPRTVDLSRMAAIDELADETIASGPLDVLVNNVGILPLEPTETDEGLDTAFAVNLLGPWHLTERLRAAETLAPGGAVITMTSGGLYNVPLSLSNLERPRRWDGTLAYAFHKRAQLALNHRWRADARGVDYFVTHPGWAATPGVSRSLPVFERLLGPLLRTPEEGADTALWLAATRPPQPTVEGIWFDRALRDEHLLWGTRDGADEAAVPAALADALARARGSARDDAPSQPAATD
jgi:NAD(P)-dependent dehydrogenase (short-subunit alcohol dehydrogenase family)